MFCTGRFVEEETFSIPLRVLLLGKLFLRRVTFTFVDAGLITAGVLKNEAAVVLDQPLHVRPTEPRELVLSKFELYVLRVIFRTCAYAWY
jgi:hypothetical protein